MVLTCVICKHGRTEPGSTSVTLERGGSTVVFKAVPAAICDICGEAYLSSETTTALLDALEAALSAGVQVAVRAYAVA